MCECITQLRHLFWLNKAFSNCQDFQNWFTPQNIKNWHNRCVSWCNVDNFVNTLDTTLKQYQVLADIISKTRITALTKWLSIIDPRYASTSKNLTSFIIKQRLVGWLVLQWPVRSFKRGTKVTCFEEMCKMCLYRVCWLSSLHENKMSHCLSLTFCVPLYRQGSTARGRFTSWWRMPAK